MRRYSFLSFFLVTIIIAIAVIGIVLYRFLATQKPELLLSPLASLGITLPALQQSQSFIVYGYLPYWTRTKAQYPKALTHVSYFSLPIQVDGHIFPDPSPPDQEYRVFKNGIIDELGQLAPHTNIEVTLTMMDQDSIPTFLATPSATTIFIEDVKRLITTYDVRGINVDIEYIRGVDETMQQQFAALMKTLYTSIKKDYPDFHISVAVLADSADKQRLTNIRLVAPYTDHIVIMAYDFHRKGSLLSGANAPLYGKADERWGKNIMASAKQFTDIVPASKIILGIPFYGYEWSVTDTSAYNFTLPDSGQTATYERIKKLLDSGSVVRHWDSTSFTPYLLYQKDGTQQQIFYEDAESLSYKIDLVKQANFGGIAIWAMGYEGGHTELWDTIDAVLR